MGERVRHLCHLVARFGASLFARDPSAVDVERVRAILTEPEFTLWAAMPRVDRAEALGTFRRLPPEIAADDRWAAAALLHDVGKTASGLGTFGRALATARGHLGDPARIGGRAGRYLRHPELGAERLRSAGARAEVVAWAATHHDPRQWPVSLVPGAVCAALAEADGEEVRVRG